MTTCRSSSSPALISLRAAAAMRPRMTHRHGRDCMIESQALGHGRDCIYDLGKGRTLRGAPHLHRKLAVAVRVEQHKQRVRVDARQFLPLARLLRGRAAQASEPLGAERAAWTRAAPSFPLAPSLFIWCIPTGALWQCRMNRPAPAHRRPPAHRAPWRASAASCPR
jgi:hypothetical protein